jgi:peptidoglycan/LPS O-acetylase OafA/YrhL
MVQLLTHTIAFSVIIMGIATPILYFTKTYRKRFLIIVITAAVTLICGWLTLDDNASSAGLANWILPPLLVSPLFTLAVFWRKSIQKSKRAISRYLLWDLQRTGNWIINLFQIGPGRKKAGRLTQHPSLLLA